MPNLQKIMTGKTCIITGATSGIGFETALALARRGAITIVVGRNQKKTEQAAHKITAITKNPSVDYLIADLSSQKDILSISEKFKNTYQSLDVLINNAGAKFVSRFETVDGYEMSIALNHLAYFLLTNLLLDLLKQSEEARIINVASGAHVGCPGINFYDLQSTNGYIGKQAYAQSKLANILFTYELSRRLEGTNVSVNALEPGGVATNFCRNNGLISWLKHIGAHILARNLVGPTEGAKTSVYLATTPEVKGVSGKYFSDQKPVPSSPVSYDMEMAKRLWDVSLELTGLTETSNTT